MKIDWESFRVRLDLSHLNGTSESHMNPINVIVQSKSHPIDHRASNVYLLKKRWQQFFKSNTSTVNFSFHLWPNVSFISHSYFTDVYVCRWWDDPNAKCICWSCTIRNGIVNINCSNGEWKLLVIKYHFIANSVSHAKFTICTRSNMMLGVDSEHEL